MEVFLPAPLNLFFDVNKKGEGVAFQQSLCYVAAAVMVKKLISKKY
jgi:hypothetical protein